MNAVDHDAQRRLEQQSLRNVRALVDKLEGETDAEQTWLVSLAIMAVLLVVLLGLAWGVGTLLKKYRDKPPAPTVITAPR